MNETLENKSTFANIWQHGPGTKLSVKASDIVPNLLCFNALNKTLAIVDANGVLRVKVEANDENAKQFVECLERAIGRRLTAVVAEQVLAE
jgi:hypothetical protein